MAEMTEAQKKFWTDAFEKANTDGKPGLTISELKAFFESFGKMTEDVEEVFKKMDLDDDKVVSLEELLNYVKNMK